MYDVMAASGPRGGAARSARPPRWARSTGAPIATARSTGEEVVEWMPALAAAQPDLRVPLLRLPDRRLAARADGARRGRALRRGAGQRRARRRADRGARTAAGVVCEEAESGERFAIGADNVVNATGVWADRIRPEELLRRGGGAAHPPEPRHARPARPRAAAAERRRDRAGGRGAHDLRAALARADAGRHDRQRLRGRASSTSARRRGGRRTTCSRR